MDDTYPVLYGAAQSTATAEIIDAIAEPGTVAIVIRKSQAFCEEIHAVKGTAANVRMEGEFDIVTFALCRNITLSKYFVHNLADKGKKLDINNPCALFRIPSCAANLLDSRYKCAVVRRLNIRLLTSGCDFHKKCPFKLSYFNPIWER